jgi:hypothetical protein
VPSYLQDFPVILEGTVTECMTIKRPPSDACGKSFAVPPLRRYEMIRLKVTRVRTGFAPADTISLVRGLSFGHRTLALHPGIRVLAYGAYLCEEYGNLAGNCAPFDNALNRYVFEVAAEPPGTGRTLPTKVQLAGSASLDDYIESLAERSNQAALNQPAAVTVVVVKGIARHGLRGTDVLCSPIGGIAGPMLNQDSFTLHFEGRLTCGLGTFLGDTLTCPLTSVDPPMVPTGHCPEEFLSRGGPISIYGVPRGRLDTIFQNTDGHIVVRAIGEK